MFDGILFDLDGTLWDAVPEITLCWNQAISAAGVDRPPLTEEEVRSCMGMQIADIAARRLPGLSFERQMAVIDDCVAVENVYLARHGAAVYPGAGETLAALSERCPLFVVSNCQDGYIQVLMKVCGLEELIRDMECFGRTGRPKGDNIRLVTERNHLDRALYVGDTAMDQEAADKAGLPFVHASYGFGQAVEPAGVIREMGELTELAKRILA